MELDRVGAGPHIRGEEGIPSIMTDVLVALLPAFLWGVYVFGIRALFIVLLSVVSSVATQALFQVILKRPVTVSDLSSAVTGLLLAMTLPANIPLWMVPLGAFAAEGILGQLLGVWLKNFVNPVLGAKILLMTLFSTYFHRFPQPFSNTSPFVLNPSKEILQESLSPFSPLESLERGEEMISPFRLMMGYGSGCIGEVSGTLLLAGLMYLLVRRTVTWHVPAFFAGTVAILSFLFPWAGDGRSAFALTSLFSGGVLLGAFFLATNYQTCPVTTWGKVVFGVLCGSLTVLFRFLFGDAWGVSLAILVCNLFAVLLDRLFIPLPYGKGKRIDLLKLLSPILEILRKCPEKIKQKYLEIIKRK